MTLPAHYTRPNALTVVPPVAVSYLDIRRDAATYPRLAAVPREVAVTALEQIVFRAFFNNAGGQLREEDAVERVSLISTELFDLLLEDYEDIGTKHLSFAEVARVIRTASVSTKREMYGVSVSGLYRAVADYCLGEGHRASQQAQAEKWAQPKPRINQTDNEQARTIDGLAANLAKLKNINGKQ